MHVYTHVYICSCKIDAHMYNNLFGLQCLHHSSITVFEADTSHHLYLAIVYTSK